MGGAGKKVKINEIGPRDGFQSVKDFIPTETKLEIIDGLVRSGIESIQCTSFVNPKAIPQMADARDVLTACLARYPDMDFYVLTPNLRGAQDAVACGAKKISFVTSVTDSHSMANVKKTVIESIRDLASLLGQFPSLTVYWDVAMAFGCGFEGEVSYEKLLSHVQKGRDLGITHFTLCDTIGIATPDIIRDRVVRLWKDCPDSVFRIHIHDTRNMGIANTLAAVECGIGDVEVALGGLGGCPFAPGASGNTSTEDLVYMLNRMGYETNVDFETLLAVARLAHMKIPGNFSGHQIKVGSGCATQ